jgi:hypothetical protein
MFVDLHLPYRSLSAAHFDANSERGGIELIPFVLPTPTNIPGAGANGNDSLRFINLRRQRNINVRAEIESN